MSSRDVHLVYVTAKDKEEALRIGRTLVEERLAACINVLDGMTSVYRWQGVLEEASETVLIAKTTRGRLEALGTRVRELHSYRVPCVLAIPVASGNDAYCQWVVDGVGE